MTSGQEKFYWRLWGMLRKADPAADRKAVHAELGLPGSHADFRNEHFDKFKGHCLAIAQPGNFQAQVQQLRMPAIRRRVFIDHLLTALEAGEEYAEAILARMNLRGAMGGAFAVLDTMGDEELEKVMIALKKECRRRWRTKEDLLGEIWTVRGDNEFPERETAEAVREALCWRSLPPLDKMYFEALLVVLSVLRRLASGAMPLPVVNAPEERVPEHF